MSSIDPMTEFYNSIRNIYQSEFDPIEKWKQIAEYMDFNYTVPIQIFQRTKKSQLNIKLDYDTSFELLQERIESESDPTVKLSYLILSLHHIIYELLSAEGNYKFSLKGNEEMTILKKDIIYYISLASKKEQNKLFHSFIILFGLESLFNGHFFVGIDYEFTNKKIQLAQLNFEHNISLESFIMIVGPSELDSYQMEDFIELIICNDSIRKILHGSDSLDIPYMYNHMLQEDPERIIKFTKTMIDTRFLCEYYKLSKNETSDNKCSIYDQDPSRSAIYYFGVISEEQQNKLSSVLESMPIHYDLDWRISSLSQSQILYAQYDVIFLKYFYYRIINVATKDVTSELEKKSIIDLYKHVLYELTQFVYLENNQITFLKEKCKEEVDGVNNYFIRNKNGIMKMIDIYNVVSTNLSSVDPKVDIDKLIRVPYFKTPILIIIKRITYGFISKNCRVQKNKNTLWTEKLDNSFIYDFFEEMGFFYLQRMFKDQSSTIQDRVKQYC